MCITAKKMLVAKIAPQAVFPPITAEKVGRMSPLYRTSSKIPAPRVAQRISIQADLPQLDVDSCFRVSCPSVVCGSIPNETNKKCKKLVTAKAMGTNTTNETMIEAPICLEPQRFLRCEYANTIGV